MQNFSQTVKEPTSIEGKSSSSRKQLVLSGFEQKPDIHPFTTSQTHQPPYHDTSLNIKNDEQKSRIKKYCFHTKVQFIHFLH